MPTYINIHELIVSEFRRVLFAPFERDYPALRKSIKTHGCLDCHPIKVSKNKRKNKF